MPEHEMPQRGSGLSRRGILALLAAGATGVLAVSADPASAYSTPLPSPPAARKANPNGLKPSVYGSVPTTIAAGAAETTLADTTARAIGSVGLPRAGSRWQHLAPTGSWNMAFVMWLLQPDSQSSPPTAEAMYAEAVAAGRVGSIARTGAIVLHESGIAGDISHVGIVEAVTTRAIMTIEGDVPGPIPSDQTFVRRYSRPLSSKLSYYYPTYRG